MLSPILDAASPIGRVMRQVGRVYVVAAAVFKKSKVARPQRPEAPTSPLRRPCPNRSPPTYPLVVGLAAINAAVRPSGVPQDAPQLGLPGVRPRPSYTLDRPNAGRP